MTEKLELKVGDKVRLLGYEWENYAGRLNIGDIVTVTEVTPAGKVYAGDAKDVTSREGWIMEGYEIEKVEETPAEAGDRLHSALEAGEVPYADDVQWEVREVNIDTVVADVNYLVDWMVTLGVDRYEAANLIMVEISRKVSRG